MTVNVTLVENTLRAEISSNGANNEYYFYLLRNGYVIDRIGWTKASCMEWKLGDSGIYKVRGFTQNEKGKIDTFSLPVDFYNDALEKSWKDFGANHTSELLDAVKEQLFAYHSYEYPFQDILIIVSPNGTRFHEFDELRKLNKCTPLAGITVYSQKPPVCGECKNIWLSGNAFAENCFVFGQDDMKASLLSAICDTTGDFISCVADEIESKVTITNDYFGNHKIYYATAGDQVFISNRYHLLLLLFRANVSASDVDKDILEAILFSGNSQPYQQAFSHKMLIDGVQLLPIDKKIEICDKKIHFVDKAICTVLTTPKENLSDESYKTILAAGAEEVKLHLQSVFSNPHFENVLLDLTGGLDSRVLFSAITNFPEYAFRIQIFSADTPGYPVDQHIALAMNGLYQYKYDGLDEIHYRENVIDKLSRTLSVLCGMYFAHDLMPLINRSQTYKPHTVNLTGFYGEICLRPYYSRVYMNTPLDGLPDEAFVDRFVSSEQHNISGDIIGLNAQKKVLLDTLRSLPGESSLEKYDYLYLFLRNGLHCSDQYRYNHSTPRVGVLQSKHWFRLKISQYHKTNATKLQRDTIALLNPVLNCFPTCREGDELDYAAMERNAPLYLHNIRFPVHFEAEKEKMLEAHSQKKVSIETISEEDASQISLEQLALDALHQLVFMHRVIREDMGKSIFAQISSGSIDYIRFNKLLMIFQQIYLANPSL